MYLETYPTLRESEVSLGKRYLRRDLMNRDQRFQQLLAVKLKRRKKDITLGTHNMPATMLGI